MPSERPTEYKKDIFDRLAREVREVVTERMFSRVDPLRPSSDDEVLAVVRSIYAVVCSPTNPVDYENDPRALRSLIDEHLRNSVKSGGLGSRPFSYDGYMGGYQQQTPQQYGFAQPQQMSPQFYGPEMNALRMLCGAMGLRLRILIDADDESKYILTADVNPSAKFMGMLTFKAPLEMSIEKSVVGRMPIMVVVPGAAPVTATGEVIPLISPNGGPMFYLL